MIVTKIEVPFRQFLESLKVPNSPNGKGGTLFSPDEINYLTQFSLPFVYEFRQENETGRKGTDGNPVNVYFANRARRAFPVTNPYFGATAGILRRFI